MLADAHHIVAASALGDVDQEPVPCLVGQKAEADHFPGG
jgi:hypothetical protein